MSSLSQFNTRFSPYTRKSFGRLVKRPSTNPSFSSGVSKLSRKSNVVVRGRKQFARSNASEAVVIPDTPLNNNEYLANIHLFSAVPADLCYREDIEQIGLVEYGTMQDEITFNKPWISFSTYTQVDCWSFGLRPVCFFCDLLFLIFRIFSLIRKARDQIMEASSFMTFPLGLGVVFSSRSCTLSGKDG